MPSRRIPLLTLFLVAAAAVAVGCSDSPTDPDGGGGDPVVWRVPLQHSLADALDGAAPNDTILIEQNVSVEDTTFIVPSNKTPLVVSLAPGSKTGDVTITGVSVGPNPPGFLFQSPRPGTRVKGLVFDGAIIGATGSGALEVTECNFEGEVNINVNANGSGDGLRLTVNDCLFLRPNLFGIRADGSVTVESVQNTIHGAGDCGILLVRTGTVGDIRRTLITDYANYGIACTLGSSLATTAGCNDVYDGAGGSTAPYLGTEAGEFSFSLDPLYCEPETGIYTVLETSPCAPLNSGSNCGNVRIGARDVGCGVDEL